MSQKLSDRPGRRPRWAKIAAIVVAIAALAALWRFTPLAHYITPARISGLSRAVHATAWAPLALMLAYTPAAFLLFPRPLLTLLAVLSFGPWLGFALAMTGILGATVTSYYVGRLLPDGTVRRLAGRKLDPAIGLLRQHGFLAVLAASVVPAVPHFMQGIITGNVRVKVWQYALGNFVGMLPGTLATTVFGDQIAAALQDPSRINYPVIGATLAVFAVLMLSARHWFVKTLALH